MNQSRIQLKLNRIRPPRVHITYDVETGGAIQQKELPFVLGVFSDLSGNTATSRVCFKNRRFLEIDMDNFADVMEGVNPSLCLQVKNLLSQGENMNVHLQFQSLKDFEPAEVVRRIEPLNKLLKLRQQLSYLQAKADGNDKFTDKLQEIFRRSNLLENVQMYTVEECGNEKNSVQETKEQSWEGGNQKINPNFLDQIFKFSRIEQDQDETELLKKAIVTLIEERKQDPITASYDLDSALNTRIAEVDRLLSLQLNEIMHDPFFQRLESSWRGLFYLVTQTETSTKLKIRVLNVTKMEILNDLQKASEFDQSFLFKKIYEEEYGTFGGTPFGAFIGDYEFGPTFQDVDLLEKISNVAAAAHAPFISAAAAQMFEIERFADLSGIRDINQIFKGRNFAKWNSFRDSENSRFIGLVLPHILLRVPFGSNSIPVEDFDFRELNNDETEDTKFLWGNAAYAVGVCLTNAFAKYGWCAAIRGVEGGGVVQGLPTYPVFGQKRLTEIIITDRREKELSDLGFIPLLHMHGRDRAAFFAMPSCQKPMRYDSVAANANSRMSTQLQYILTTSRFAHYIKALMRDKVGSFLTRGDCQDYLNRWIGTYVLSGSEELGHELKAKYPLREARIDVGEIAGKPGVYQAIVFLKPHFMLDELSVSLRLVVQLPVPARG